MKQGKIIRDFTQGPLFWPLLSFALPFMLSNALQVAYSMTDMLITGRYVGHTGLSAVATASQATDFITMVGFGVSTGGQVLISQLIGKGRRDQLQPTIGTLFSLVIICAAVASIGGLTFARPFLRLLKTPDESFASALDYLRVMSCGFFFIFGYSMVAAVLRGMGDSRHPFMFMMISSVTNVTLDLVFIAGFKWGVFGGALATVMAQALAFLCALVFLYRHRESFGFDFQLKSLRIHPPILAVLVKLGIPFSVRFGAIHLSMLYVNSLINGLGVAASATYGVGTRLDNLANRVSQGVMMALSTIVGQNMGAGNFQRIRKSVYYGWAICATMFGAYAAVLLTFTREMYGCFTDNPDVLRLSAVFVKGLILHYPALLIMKGTNGFLQGIGNANFGLAIALTDGLIARISLSWLLGIYFKMGLYGFIAGYALATYVTAIPSMLYFFFWPWEKRKLVLG